MSIIEQLNKIENPLKQFGYAPGGYEFICPHCKRAVPWVYKHATSCEDCATKMYNQAIKNLEQFLQTPISFKYTYDQLVQLKEHADSIRQIEQKPVHELTQQLYLQLCDRVKSFVKFPALKDWLEEPSETIWDQLFNSPYNGACGCMGPRDGELYCGCTMRNLQYEYRYDIALGLINTMP